MREGKGNVPPMLVVNPICTVSGPVTPKSMLTTPPSKNTPSNAPCPSTRSTLHTLTSSTSPSPGSLTSLELETKNRSGTVGEDELNTSTQKAMERLRRPESGIGGMMNWRDGWGGEGEERLNVWIALRGRRGGPLGKGDGVAVAGTVPVPEIESEREDDVSCAEMGCESVRRRVRRGVGRRESIVAWCVAVVDRLALVKCLCNYAFFSTQIRPTRGDAIHLFSPSREFLWCYGAGRWQWVSAATYICSLTEK